MNPKQGGMASAVEILCNACTRLQSRVISCDSSSAIEYLKTAFPIDACGPGKGRFGWSPKLGQAVNTALHHTDVLVIHGLWQYHNIIGLQAANKIQVPYAVFPHGMLDPWSLGQSRLVKNVAWRIYQRRIMQKAFAICFTTEDERDASSAIFDGDNSNHHIVPLGTLPPPENLDHLRRQFFDLHPHLVGRRLILFLGRIHHKKGCNILIKAFADLMRSSDGASFHLLMVGPFENESYKKELQRLCEAYDLGPDSISFPGMVSGLDKWRYLASAEVFTLPSHQENFALAVSEALSCGTPVLLSDKVNIWRTIHRGEAGLVAENTLEGLREMLFKWKDLPEARRLFFARNAINVHQTEFSTEQTKHAFEALTLSIDRRIPRTEYCQP